MAWRCRANTSSNPALPWCMVTTARCRRTRATAKWRRRGMKPHSLPGTKCDEWLRLVFEWRLRFGLTELARDGARAADCFWRRADHCLGVYAHPFRAVVFAVVRQRAHYHADDCGAGDDGAFE